MKLNKNNKSNVIFNDENNILYLINANLSIPNEKLLTIDNKKSYPLWLSIPKTEINKKQLLLCLEKILKESGKKIENLENINHFILDGDKQIQSGFESKFIISTFKNNISTCFKTMFYKTKFKENDDRKYLQMSKFFKTLCVLDVFENQYDVKTIYAKLNTVFIFNIKVFPH